MLDYPLEDSAALVALAREDAGLTMQMLADRAGVNVSVIEGVEAGPYPTDPSIVTALLLAAGIRPAIPLGFYASKLRDLAERAGIEAVKVFGSAARGLDNSASDVDLLVRLPKSASGFALAGFQMEAQKILGFPLDLMLEDAAGPIADRARGEAVAL